MFCDSAFERKVLLATPTNLIAIARTVAAVWRQEKLAGQARKIAALGKELYARMSVMGSHIARVGKNLDQATGAYNAFVGRSEEHTSELQSLMRISYAVFCLKTKKKKTTVKK